MTDARPRPPTRAELAARKAAARVLADLELPPILPGDTAPAGVREVLLAGPDISLRRGGAQFYGENGEPLNLPTREAFARIAEVRNRPGGEINVTLRSGRGVPILVTTAYLGVDLSLAGPLPLVWETLVFVGDKALGMLEPVRYATRAAAHAGHQSIVAAIRSAVESQ